MKSYIAAGFDPARFWEITPRLFATEMEGAAIRMESRRAEIWATAMLPHLEKPPGLDEFVSGTRDRRGEIAKCLDAWNKVDRALARNR